MQLPFAAVVALAVISMAPASSEGVTGFADPANTSREIRQDHMMPHLQENEGYSEYWEQYFFFDNGYAVFSQFMITNLGWGDRSAGVFSAVIAPDGAKTVLKNGRKEGNWRFSTDRFELLIAHHFLRGGDPQYEMRLKNSSGEVNLKFTSKVDVWRPGRMVFGEDGFYDLTVTAPWAAAEGTWQPPEGQAVSLKGGGFAIHYYTNVANYKLAKKWYKFGASKDGTAIFLMGLTTPKSYGEKPLAWLVVSETGKASRAFFDVSLTENVTKTDVASKNRYEVPISFGVSAEDGNASVTGRIKASKLLQRWDVLDGLDKLERTVVEKLSMPVQYRFVSRYSLIVFSGNSKKEISGEGISEVIWVNP